MKRIPALLCALLFLIFAAGCQPSQEALLQRGIETEDYSLESLCDRVEASILAGEDELNINYRGKYKAVDRAVQSAMEQIQGNLGYLAGRFIKDYSVTCTEEKGYVPTRITWALQHEELLADMPREPGGDIATEAYAQEALEALLLHMMETKQARAIRHYERTDLDGFNKTLNQDLEAIMGTNYAYGYLVDTAEWTLSEYAWEDGQAFLELDITLTYLPDTLPLAELPVVTDRIEMIDALVEGWEAGEKKVTLILEGLRPDEDTLFAWINTAEVNSATLACEGDSIWYEVLENPGNRQIGRFWLEYGASEELVAPAQERLKRSIKTEAEALRLRLTDHIGFREGYKAVFDRVLALTEYDDDIRDATEAERLTEQMQVLRSAYGALVAGRTVCTGYARAFQALCDELGLPCWTVNGYQDGDGHAWNMVYLDGQVLYVDCTFADTSGRPERYFLFTQNELEKWEYEMDEGFVTPW